MDLVTAISLLLGLIGSIGGIVWLKSRVGRGMSDIFELVPKRSQTFSFDYLKIESPARVFPDRGFIESAQLITIQPRRSELDDFEISGGNTDICKWTTELRTPGFSIRELAPTETTRNWQRWKVEPLGRIDLSQPINIELAQTVQAHSTHSLPRINSFSTARRLNELVLRVSFDNSPPQSATFREYDRLDRIVSEETLSMDTFRQEFSKTVLGCRRSHTFAIEW